MKNILYIFLFLASLPVYAQGIIDGEEITLPDYLLSPTTENNSQKPTGSDIPISFEDELEALLNAEQETLPLYKFNASIFVLNKNTNAVENYTLELGNTILYGSLEIQALNCLHNYESIANNDYVFLDVIDSKTKGYIYHGWMSKRLAGINPFSHSTYSIRVTGCKVSNELITKEIEEAEVEVENTPEELPQIEELPTIIEIEQPQSFKRVVIPAAAVTPTTVIPQKKLRIKLPDNIILLPEFDNTLEIIRR